MPQAYIAKCTCGRESKFEESDGPLLKMHCPLCHAAIVSGWLRAATPEEEAAHERFPSPEFRT